MIDPARTAAGVMSDPFRYIPPTDQTAPLHAAVTAAERACADTIGRILTGAPWLGEHSGHFVAADACDEICAACMAFFREIQRCAPPGADRDAAERCVRLARMHANSGVRADGDALRDAHRRAMDNVISAGMQARAAIALGSA